MFIFSIQDAFDSECIQLITAITLLSEGDCNFSANHQRNNGHFELRIAIFYDL